MATRARGGSRRTNNSRAARDPDGTRKALLKSALTLFERYGYDATPVQRIVDDARLTKGAFYHHFESKEDLLHELHDEFIDFQLERAHAVLERDEPPDEMLRQFVVEVLLEPLGIYRSEITVFLQERRFLSAKAFSQIKTKRDEFENCLVEVIQRGVDAGVFKQVGPPRLLAFGVIGMCAWTYTWLDPKGSATPHEIGEMYADVVVDGLKGKPRR